MSAVDLIEQTSASDQNWKTKLQVPETVANSFRVVNRDCSTSEPIAAAKRRWERRA
jgi:hypothetical protein